MEIDNPDHPPQPGFKSIISQPSSRGKGTYVDILPMKAGQTFG